MSELLEACVRILKGLFRLRLVPVQGCLGLSAIGRPWVGGGLRGSESSPGVLGGEKLGATQTLERGEEGWQEGHEWKRYWRGRTA